MKGFTMKVLFKRGMILGLGLVASVLLLQSCASDQQGQEQQGEVNAAVEENAAAVPEEGAEATDVAQQGEAGQEFSESDDGNLGGDQAMAQGDQGAGINNAAEEQFTEEGNSQEGLAEAEPAEENAVEPAEAVPADAGPADATAQAQNMTAVPEAAAADAAAAAVPQVPQATAAAAPATQAAPAAAPQSQPLPAAAPSSGSVVKYVTVSGVNLYAAPDGKSVVKPLEQGDHPLVNDEGEWSKTSDGYFIQNSSLTTSPVGRVRTPKTWQ
jgi:hypothetical protein